MITMSSFKYAGLIISIIISLISCTHNKNYPTAFQPELAKAEAMMYRYPDSALHILQGIQPDIPSENEQYATWALLMTQAQYKNQIEQSDSLINIAYSYFTKHDNAQRKALALYYKGILRHESHHAEDALSFYLEAATEIEKTNDYQLGFLINSEVGLMYLYRKLNDYAMEYFEKAHHNAELSDNQTYILAGSKEQTEVHDSVKGLAAMNKNCRYEIWDKAAHNIPPVFSKQFNELIIRMAEI